MAMNNTTLNDQALIQELLRRMASRKPGIPADKVKKFVANLGQEIERSGGLSKEHVDLLLKQLKNGEL
jgi:hypothetical protein